MQQQPTGLRPQTPIWCNTYVCKSVYMCVRLTICNKSLQHECNNQPRERPAASMTWAKHHAHWAAARLMRFCRALLTWGTQLDRPHRPRPRPRSRPCRRCWGPHHHQRCQHVDRRQVRAAPAPAPGHSCAVTLTKLLAPKQLETRRLHTARNQGKYIKHQQNGNIVRNGFVAGAFVWCLTLIMLSRLGTFFAHCNQCVCGCSVCLGCYFLWALL